MMTNESRAKRRLRAAVRSGLGDGLFAATGFSAFVALMALLRGSMTYDEFGGLQTWHVVAFYYAAGIVGGAVYGLLSPLRDRYWGKLLTASLVWFIVYGGCLVALGPWLLEGEDDISMGTFLLALAGLSVLLSPFMVYYFDDRRS